MPVKTLEPGVVGEIRLACLSGDPDQPRKHFDPEALQQLANDIAARGVLQPITVMPNGKKGHYQVVMGERRLRASELAGLERVPCLLSTTVDGNTSAIDKLLDQVAENQSRADLDPIEMGQVFVTLRDDHGIKVGDMSGLCADRGFKTISRSYISNHMRLTGLPDWVQSRIRSGEWPAAWGKWFLVAQRSERVMNDLESLVKDDPESFETRVSNITTLATLICDAIGECYAQCQLDLLTEIDIEQHRKDLDILKITAPWEGFYYITNLGNWPGGTVREFALNTELFDQLLNEKLQRQREHEEAQQQAQENTGTESGEGAGTKPGKNDTTPDAEPAGFTSWSLSSELKDWLEGRLIEQINSEPEPAAPESLCNAIIDYTVLQSSDGWPVWREKTEDKRYGIDESTDEGISIADFIAPRQLAMQSDDRLRLIEKDKRTLAGFAIDVLLDGYELAQLAQYLGIDIDQFRFSAEYLNGHPTDHLTLDDWNHIIEQLAIEGSVLQVNWPEGYSSSQELAENGDSGNALQNARAYISRHAEDLTPPDELKAIWQRWLPDTTEGESDAEQ